MEDTQFDNLARRLARPLSRRQVCKTLVATVFGGWFIRSGVRDVFAANDACAHFCDAVYPPGSARGVCKSEAAAGTGVCFDCGPSAASPAPQICGLESSLAFCCPAAAPACCDNTTCADLTSDTKNCGGCDVVCSTGSSCVNSTCVQSSRCTSGGKCPSFPMGCNGNDSCLCYTLLGGGAGCGPNVACGTACDASSPCPDGSFCGVDLCCGGDATHGFCIPVCTVGVAAPLDPLVQTVGPTSASM